MTGGGDGFLGRWSRRKREAEAAPEEAVAETAAPEAAPPPAPEPEAEADPDLLASLPRLEDITASTDIRVFLQKGVPAALRNAALRRAWVADPVIATYQDPARDYFWDWNAPGGVPGGGGTLDPGRVAKMVRDLAGEPEPEADDSPRAATAEAPAAPPAPPAPPATPDPVAETPAADTPTPVADLRPDPSPRAGNTAPAPAPRRRHGGALPG